MPSANDAINSDAQSPLAGRRIAVLAADGVEQVELTEPWKAVEQAGGKPELVAPEGGSIQGFNHLDQADTFPVDREAAKVSAGDFDALVLPGGVANPDALRMDDASVAFVKGFAEANKPIAVICHGPWTLVEADVVATYQEATGVEVGDLRWFHVWCAVAWSAILMRVTARRIRFGELPEGAEDDVWLLTERERQALGISPLPRNLDEAVRVMERSELAAETLGEHVFDFFLRNKRAEWNDYRAEVTQFEIDRLLPVL